MYIKTKEEKEDKHVLVSDSFNYFYSLTYPTHYKLQENHSIAQRFVEKRLLF